MIGRVEARLAVVEDALILEPELERDGAAVDAQEREPEHPAPGRPRCEAVVEAASVVARRDRRLVLPAGALERVSLLHQLLEPLAAVRDLDLDRAFLLEPPPAPPDRADEVLAAPSEVRVEVAVDAQVRRALEDPLERAEALRGRRVPAGAEVVAGEQLERHRAAAAEHPGGQLGARAAVFREQPEVERLGVRRRAKRPASALERRDSGEAPVAADGRKLELPGAEGVPPGLDEARAEKRRRPGAVRKRIPLRREGGEVALEPEFHHLLTLDWPHGARRARY